MHFTAFFNSAIGLAVKVAVYVAAAAALAAAVLGAAGGHISLHDILYAALIAGGNSLLVFVKGAADPTTPTFPGSSVAPPTKTVTAGEDGSPKPQV